MNEILSILKKTSVVAPAIVNVSHRVEKEVSKSKEIITIHDDNNSAQAISSNQLE